jgi:hypothetical protein
MAPTQKTDHESPVRQARGAKDWDFIRRTCALTGNGGEPIGEERFKFFAKVWVDPYASLCPQWGYVLESDTLEKPVGYLTGCSATEAFERQRRVHSDLGLFRGLLVARRPLTSDERRFYRRFMKSDVGPEKAFGKKFLRHLYDHYPAHLHMNLLPEARGSGGGTLLFKRYWSDLNRAGVRGLHVFCGEKPVSFYQRQGMIILKRIEYRPEVFVYALGLKNDSR